MSIDDILAAKQRIPQNEDLESAVKALLGWVPPPPAAEGETPPLPGGDAQISPEVMEGGVLPPGRLERGLGADAPTGDESSKTVAAVAAKAVVTAVAAAAAARGGAFDAAARVQGARTRILGVALLNAECAAEGAAAAAERVAADAVECVAAAAARHAAAEAARARDTQRRQLEASYVAQRVWRRCAARKTLAKRMAAVVLLAQRAEAGGFLCTVTF